MSAPLIAPHGLARLIAAWPAHDPQYQDRMPKAGDLVAIDTPRPLPGQVAWATSGLDGQGYRRKADELELERNPALSWTDFDALLRYYLRGRARLPNLEPLDTLDGLRSIASAGGMGAWPHIATVKLPGDDSNWGTWARVFLGYTQGGKLDGVGYLIAYQRKGATYPHGPIWRFKLCEHEVVNGAGARPERGWHPGRCARCGLDVSVDSGD